MGGSASSSRPGSTQRRGPSHEIGLAVGDQIGSVRKLTPPSWTSSVEWPIQVAVGTLCRAFSRRKAPSLATRSGAPGRPAIEVRDAAELERQRDPRARALDLARQVQETAARVAGGGAEGGGRLRRGRSGGGQRAPPRAIRPSPSSGRPGIARA